MSLTVKQTRWCCEALFFIAAFLYLGIYNADYLYRLQAQNLFLSNTVFAGETLPQSAGLLVYVSKFLLQLLSIPLLGAGLMAAGLVGIERLMGVLMNSSESITRQVLAFVPSFLIVMAQVSAGYAVYENFDTSYAISLELGFAISLGVAAMFAWLTDNYQMKGFLGSALLTILLYFSVGIFAPFAMLMAGAKYLFEDKKLAVQFLLSGVLLGVILSLLATSLVQEDFEFTLLAPIAVPYFANLFGYSLLALVVAFVLVALPSTFQIKFLEKFYMAFVCLVIFGAGSYYYSYRDANYRTLVTMQRCTENSDWEGILKASEKVERPTRAIAAYRYVALEMTDRLNSELFNFPVRYDTLNSPYNNINPLVFYPDLFFYSSQLNTSLVWTMESWTNTCRRVSDLRRFALIALLQSETETARKYLSLLKQTFAYSAWAEDYEKYLDNPKQLLADHPALDMVCSNQLPFNDHYTSMTTLPELMLSYKNLDPKNMERRLLLHLYDKDTKGFMADLQMVAPMYKDHMPVYMQEVIALYAMNTQLNVMSYFPIQQDVVEKVRMFVKAAKPYYNDFDNGAAQLKEWQGMYLYYLLFSNPYPNANNVNK